MALPQVPAGRAQQAIASELRQSRPDQLVWFSSCVSAGKDKKCKWIREDKEAEVIPIGVSSSCFSKQFCINYLRVAQELLKILFKIFFFWSNAFISIFQHTNNAY
jgi:hypothetical protein